MAIGDYILHLREGHPLAALSLQTIAKVRCRVVALLLSFLQPSSLHVNHCVLDGAWGGAAAADLSWTSPALARAVQCSGNGAPAAKET